MRITCPGCGAQYEVAEDAIPAGGRDVQCSACGHVWFVAGAGGGTEPDAEPDADEPAAGDEPAAAAEDSAPEPEPEPAPEPAPAPRRPALSPEVTAILREEAERERARREAERAAQQVAAQAELGLDAAMPPPARRPVVPPAPAPDPEAEAPPEPPEALHEAGPEASPEPQSDPDSPPRPAADPQRGRARLPDIEEINASLRAATERAPAHVAEPASGARGGGGFRAGFFSVVVLALLALGAYVAAPRIARSVPAAAPVLGHYVAGVDEFRLWLDLKVQALLPADAGRSADEASRGRAAP